MVLLLLPLESLSNFSAVNTTRLPEVVESVEKPLLYGSYKLDRTILFNRTGVFLLFAQLLLLFFDPLETLIE